MANKEEKVKKEKKEVKKVEHKDGHSVKDTTEPKRKSSKYRKLIEKYKRRNRIIEVIIACFILVIVFCLACNTTFLKTSFSKKIDNSTFTIELPRFTYYVKSDNDKVVFKTLRKSENTKRFFEEYLEDGVTDGKFEVYLCNDSNTKYYYDSVGKYFITDIKVEKSFVIKTVTVEYSVVEPNIFCSTVEKVIEDEL